MQRAKLAKESEATVPAKTLPHRLSSKLSDGLHHYTSENGANIALMKDGDTYHVYDYSTGNISKSMTMQDVNKALKSHYTSAAVETNSDSKIAAAMPLAEATADLSAETKNAADSTEVESAVEETNYLVRDNSPNEFNPDGKSLKGQLEEALDNSKSREQRYVYVGEFTQEFVNKLKEHIDIKMHPVVMNYRDAYLSMESKENGKYQGNNINYHNLGIDGLESAINSFGDPEYVILSTKNNKIELILEGSDYKGRQLFSVVEINTKTLNNNKFMDAHVVTTVYGHRGIHNRIIVAENENRLIYNKNESAQGITPVQYQRNINANSLSGDNTITTNSISDSSEKINSFDKNSSEKVSSYEKLKAQNAEIAKFAEENIKDYKNLSEPSRRAVRAVIRQGRAHGLSDADIITIASVSAHSGAKINFSKEACKRTNKKGETFYVDGFYDGDTDTITVNPEKTRTTDKLLLHELLHDITMHLGGTKKGFKLYKKLVKQAFNNMSEEQQKGIVEKYQEMGETRDSVLTEEILAHYGEAFANKAFFEAMLKERQSLGKRILNFFKSAVTDYAGDERLTRSARKFQRAFKKLFDEYSSQNSNTNAYGENLRLSDGENTRSATATLEKIADYSDLDNAEIYSYDFLISRNDMQVATLPEINSVVNENGKIVRSDIIKLGLANAVANGKKVNDSVFVTNNYTNRDYRITTESIRHSLGGDRNRLLTNARVSSVIGEIVKNGIPINSLHNTAENVKGTYALATLSKDNDGNLYVSIATIEERTNNVISVEEYDVVHSVSARQKNNRDAWSGTKPQGKNPPTNISATISIADFLKIVNTTYQSILSDDVLRAFEEHRDSNGYYSNRVKYALSADFDIAKGSISSKEAESKLKDLKTYAKKITPSSILATQIQFTNTQAGIEAAGKALGIKGIEAEVQAVRASKSQAQEMLGGQQWSIMGDKYVKEGDGFYKIIEPIQAKGEQYYEDFQQFLFHRHNIDRMSLEERSIAKNEAKKTELQTLEKKLKELETQLVEINADLKVLKLQKGREATLEKRRLNDVKQGLIAEQNAAKKIFKFENITVA